MDYPVHDVIIGNVPGAKDPQLNCESSTPMTIVPDIETQNTDKVCDEEAHESENKVIGGAEYSADMSQTDGKCTTFVSSIQTRAKSEEVNRKKKELKVVHVPGTEVTTEELIELQQRDLVLLLLPTELNKLTLSWRGPFTVVGKVGNVDYKVKVASGKVKTFHINMLKKYYQREATNDKKQNKRTRVQHQAAAIASVLEDENDETNSTAVLKDSDLMPLYNVVQSVNDVVINPELSAEQINKVKSLLKEYSDIFTDVPKITHLAKHRVDLTQEEPMRSKTYPTPYKMEEVISNEIDDMLERGIIERSEAAYASPLDS